MALSVITGDDRALLAPLAGRRVGVVGFGNQGSAHALNLRESGVDVVVGHRQGRPGAERAAAAVFAVRSPAEVAAAADLLVLALPDEMHAEAWSRELAPHVRPGTSLGFLHGFSVRFGLVRPPADVSVVMVAPKGPGTLLRARFRDGQGLPCLVGVHHDASGARGQARAIAIAWAAGIGAARAAIVETTFAAETETDLFGEQAVLCGGMTALVAAAFDTLVGAGYPPELAYLECCQEVKQVADLVYERGLAGMMEAISNTAEFGAHRAAGVIADDALRGHLRDLLAAIRDGSFARDFTRDHAAGFPWFAARRRALRQHPAEPAGAAVRAWMPWLRSAGAAPDREGSR
jgi:ketol-acid reductoisomerase